MRQRITITMVSLFIALVVSARAGDSGGAVALPYLQNGMGARALGMGQAYSAFASGADALFWNPAGLDGDRYELMLNHQPLMTLMNLDVGSFAMPVGMSNLGITVTQMKSDTIDAFDVDGNPDGTLHVKDQVVSAGYAYGGRGWSWGVAGKNIRSELGNAAASTWAGDAGIRIRNPLSDHFSHAIVVQNLGRSISFGDHVNSLPSILRVGTAFQPSRKMNFGFDATASKGGSLNAALGGEFNFFLAKNMEMSARCGYNTSHRDEGELAGVGFGGGLRLSGFRLDAAWVSESEIGSTQIYTFTYAFGSTSHQTKDENVLSRATTPQKGSKKENSMKLSLDVQLYNSDAEALTRMAQTQNGSPTQ